MKNDFLDTLRQEVKSEEKIEIMHKELEQCIDKIADRWSDEILGEIKQEIAAKAKSGQFTTENGRKKITGEYEIKSYRERVLDFYNNKTETALTFEKAASMGIVPDCSYSLENTDEFNYMYLRYERYYNFDMVPKWTSRVSRSLKLSQQIFGLLTFGISLLCRLSEDAEPYSVFSGKIGYTDSLSVKTCKLLEKKMVKEKIILKNYTFYISSGRNDKKTGFRFKSIDDDVFVKCYEDTRLYKKKYRYGNAIMGYNAPSISYEVTF